MAAVAGLAEGINFCGSDLGCEQIRRLSCETSYSSSRWYSKIDLVGSDRDSLRPAHKSKIDLVGITIQTCETSAHKSGW